MHLSLLEDVLTNGNYLHASFPDTVQSHGELRLARGNTTSYSFTSGRLEVYLNGSWGTICDDADFGWAEATVACQQLGWSGASDYGYSISMG